MNTQAGRQKQLKTNLTTDPTYYKKLASKGGKKSTYRPMRDPEVARKLANMRWHPELIINKRSTNVI